MIVTTLSGNLFETLPGISQLGMFYWIGILLCPSCFIGLAYFFARREACMMQRGGKPDVMMHFH